MWCDLLATWQAAGQAGASRSDEESERSGDEQRSGSTSPVPEFAKESRKRGRGAMAVEEQGVGRKEEEEEEADLKRLHVQRCGNHMKACRTGAPGKGRECKAGAVMIC